MDCFENSIFDQCNDRSGTYVEIFDRMLLDVLLIYTFPRDNRETAKKNRNSFLLYTHKLLKSFHTNEAWKRVQLIVSINPTD